MPISSRRTSAASHPARPAQKASRDEDRKPEAKAKRAQAKRASPSRRSEDAKAEREGEADKKTAKAHATSALLAASPVTASGAATGSGVAEAVASSIGTAASGAMQVASDISQSASNVLAPLFPAARSGSGIQASTAQSQSPNPSSISGAGDAGTKNQRSGGDIHDEAFWKNIGQKTRALLNLHWGENEKIEMNNLVHSIDDTLQNIAVPTDVPSNEKVTLLKMKRLLAEFGYRNGAVDPETKDRADFEFLDQRNRMLGYQGFNERPW